MKCPRCNAQAYHHKISDAEFSLICDFCGFYSARLIDHIHFGHPIFKRILLEPQGVILTNEKNYQYFSEEQKDMLLRIHGNNNGYTYYDSKKRKWRVKRQTKTDDIELLFMK